MRQVTGLLILFFLMITSPKALDGLFAVDDPATPDTNRDLYRDTDLTPLIEYEDPFEVDGHRPGVVGLDTDRVPWFETGFTLDGINLALDCYEPIDITNNPSDLWLVDVDVNRSATEDESFGRSVPADHVNYFISTDTLDCAKHAIDKTGFSVMRFVPVEPASTPVWRKSGSRVIGRIVDGSGTSLTEICVVPLIDSSSSSRHGISR